MNKFTATLILIICVLSGTLIMTYEAKKAWKQDSIAKQVIIENEQIKYRDSQNRWVNESSVWDITFANLKNANTQLEKSLKDGSYKISEQQKQLGELYKIIKEYEIRNKDLQSASATQMNTINRLNTIINVLYDSVGNTIIQIDSINTKHLKINFTFTPPNNLSVLHSYQNTITSIVELRAKRKENGRKHFPLGNWKWLWGTEQKVYTTSEDTSAIITNNIQILFK